MRPSAERVASRHQAAFDWDTASDAERLAWAEKQLAITERRLATATANLSALANRKAALDRQFAEASDAKHALSERASALRGHVDRYRGR